MTIDYTSFAAVLQWIALAGGGVYLTGKALSFLVENWATWHTLPHYVKVLSPLVFSVVISVGANLMMQNVEVVAIIGPWFKMISLAVITYYGSQVAYMQSKKADYASKIQE